MAANEVRLWRTRVDFGVFTESADATVIARYVEPGEAVNRHDVPFEMADLSTLVLRAGASEEVPHRTRACRADGRAAGDGSRGHRHTLIREQESARRWSG